MADKAPTSRAEQRRGTENRILEAARKNFSEFGYDRTTIRAIAATAKVNPGLVMHYFGSKENLFARAISVFADESVSGTPIQVAERILAELQAKLSDEPTAALAMLRSMLTHPDAAKSVRDMLSHQQRQVSDALTSEDAVLRGGLTSATILGVIIGRYLLKLDGLSNATPEQITALLKPCLESLTQNNSESS